MSTKLITGISAFLLFTFLLSGCEWMQGEGFCSGYKVEELKLNETVELRYGTEYCNPGHEIRLSFDSIQDGRCPIGVYCIWEGNGRVKLTLEESGTISSFWLNTFDNFLTDTVIGGIRYELVDILPYPDISKDYDLKDQSVLLLISDRPR